MNQIFNIGRFWKCTKLYFLQPMNIMLVGVIAIFSIIYYQDTNSSLLTAMVLCTSSPATMVFGNHFNIMTPASTFEKYAGIVATFLADTAIAVAFVATKLTVANGADVATTTILADSAPQKAVLALLALISFGIVQMLTNFKWINMNTFGFTVMIPIMTYGLGSAICVSKTTINPLWLTILAVMAIGAITASYLTFKKRTGTNSI